MDFKTSAEVHRTVVLPGVDDELDEIKRTYEGIESLLNQTSKDIANSIPNEFSLDLNVIFFPQIGFLIAMPIDPISGRAEYEGGDNENQRWERIFSTSNRVYYKDACMLELDETFGDLYAVICGELTNGFHMRRCASAVASKAVQRQLTKYQIRRSRSYTDLQQRY